jgi:hypothetical protein
MRMMHHHKQERTRMGKKQSLMMYVSDIVTGLEREEFLQKHKEPVLVQAYHRKESVKNSQSLESTLSFTASSSAIINPDDLSVHVVGPHGDHPFNGQLIYVGRSPDMDIVIDDKRVSRRHAEFTIKNGSYFISDCSTNGTYVNNTNILRGVARPLEDGCTVAFDPKYRMSFTLLMHFGSTYNYELES